MQVLFPEVSNLRVTSATFQKVKYNRKTASYRPVIEIARLLLLNYSPDIRNGQQHILAILFDMNVLFEEYIYRLLKRAASKDILVSRQRSKRFWEYKLIRPDILVKKGDQTIVVDTKWKILDFAKPSDADLKQMYVYHHYFAAQQTILLYPEVSGIKGELGQFHIPKEEAYSCKVSFTSIIDENGLLDREAGQGIIKELLG